MTRKLFFGAVAASLLLGVSTSGYAGQAQENAPEFVGGPWLNTKDGKPVTIASRRGKVTLVAFWTFDCINCRHNMAAYERLLRRYRSKGVELISVHTPELPEEHDAHLVATHIQKFGIDYPVVLDNNNANWDRWHVQYWPSLFVVDGQGVIRYHWFGELNYEGAGGEAAVRRVVDEMLGE